MSYNTGMVTERTLARMRHAELVEEAAGLRAEQARTRLQSARMAWLGLSLVVLVLVAVAAWLLIVG